MQNEKDQDKKTPAGDWCQNKIEELSSHTCLVYILALTRNISMKALNKTRNSSRCHFRKRHSRYPESIKKQLITGCHFSTA